MYLPKKIDDGEQKLARFMLTVYCSVIFSGMLNYT